MLKEGLFDKYKPEVAFGLHVMSTLHAGEIGIRSGSFMAGSDAYRIHVVGRQTHGARPWGGVDPIVTSAQIINALQTVVSRQIDITANPAIVTVGAIKGGIRNNIIPDDVEMIGTIRNFDPQQREQIIKAMERIVTNTAAANGATATLEINPGGNPVTYNSPELTARVLPTLQRVAGDGHVHVIPLITGAEDFSYFAQKVPSVFFHVGITPLNESAVTAPSNHSPQFHIDESGIPLAARALAAVAVDYLTSAGSGAAKSGGASAGR
jgi:amidohydrolase